MRRRRLGRCLLRADLAIEDRHPDEARAALAEAREIGADSPEIRDLEDRLRELESDAPAPRQDGLRAARPLLAAGAALLLASLVLLGSGLWRSVPSDDDSGVAVASVPPVTDVASGAELAAAPASGPVRSGLRVLREIISAPAIRPRVLAEELEGTRPPVMAPPIANAGSAAAPPPVTESQPPAQPPRPEPPPATPVAAPETTVAMGPSRPPIVERAPDPLPPVTPPRPPPTDAVPAASSVPPRVPPVSEPVRTVDETAGIRAALQRYAMAYNRLDAEAASAVWPAVDRGALERAFDGLVSQQVSLGDCDLRIHGAAAQAVCAGSATWQPKVGGRARTEPRQWSFELRKSGDGWQIERAVARGGA